jgi:radical SAM/Cys-rich protein
MGAEVKEAIDLGTDVISQLKTLNEITRTSQKVPAFKDKLASSGVGNFKPKGLEIFQVNIGKVCNQTCKHCHVYAGPLRTELMDRQTMQYCIDAISKYKIPIVDITGGAPELNPDFRWFVMECRKLCDKVIIRCNLTIFSYRDEYRDLPDFYAENGVEVVSSLPYYDADHTDRVRGKGVFDASINGLQMLNARGYGKEDTGLILNLAYNPAGAFFPAPQDLLEAEFKKELFNNFGIVFNNLFTLYNIPVGRFLDYLIRSDNYLTYMENLVKDFNPVAAIGSMCLNMISVSWDGYLYDCDFNQMLEMKVSGNTKNHISDFDIDFLLKREVRVSQHCYGCTAGAGSSCGGATD